MSDVVAAAVSALSEKMDGGFAAGTAKFVIEDEGAIMVDGRRPNWWLMWLRMT